MADINLCCGVECEAKMKKKTVLKNECVIKWYNMKYLCRVVRKRQFYVLNLIHLRIFYFLFPSICNKATVPINRIEWQKWKKCSFLILEFANANFWDKFHSCIDAKHYQSIFCFVCVCLCLCDDWIERLKSSRIMLAFAKLFFCFVSFFAQFSYMTSSVFEYFHFVQIIQSNLIVHIFFSIFDWVMSLFF